MLRIFICGLIGYSIPPIRPFMLFSTPFVLLGVNGYFLIQVYRKSSDKLKIWLTVVMLVTFIIEIIGVGTGRIFGAYHYGDVLGVKFFGVPLLIGPFWGLTVLGSIELIQKITRNPNLSLFLIPSFLVLFDILLEPVAVRLGYWSWGGPVPMQNYIAWFLIGFSVSIPFYTMKLESNIKELAEYYVIQSLFFVALNIIL